jgi:uncharacterized membrane protein YhdT
MKKLNPLIATIACTLLLSGCTSTFGGTILVITFKDLLLYVGIAFLISFLISIFSPSRKGRRAFWIWFILSLLLTPLAGFIYLLILFTKKTE